MALGVSPLEVSFPILAADFLQHHGLLVDGANLRLPSEPSIAA